MKARLAFVTSLSLLSLAACQSHEPIVKETRQTDAGTTKVYGAPLAKAAAAVPIEQVVKQAGELKGKTVTTTGRVRRNCTAKGCWMEVAPTMRDADQGARVTFKDYGFFVPTDSLGSKARVQGVVETQTVKASHVRHMEAEGAHFARKNPDGTAQEVRIVATGVELTR